MKISIRKVRKSDLVDMENLFDDEWNMFLQRYISRFVDIDGKIERCYIAHQSGMLVGFIYGFCLPNRVLLPEMLYVRNEYRKQGIGTKLLAYLEKKSGCESAMIFYDKTLHNYYAKRGYIYGDNLETAIKLFEYAEGKES